MYLSVEYILLNNSSFSRWKLIIKDESYIIVIGEQLAGNNPYRIFNQVDTNEYFLYFLI